MTRFDMSDLVVAVTGFLGFFILMGILLTQAITCQVKQDELRPEVIKACSVTCGSEGVRVASFNGCTCN